MSNTNEHAFAQFIRIIGKGKTGRRSLTQQEAQVTMQMILANEIKPLQLGAFLMVLRVKDIRLARQLAKQLWNKRSNQLR